MQHGKLAFLLSTGIMLGLASGTVPVYAEATDVETFSLGNSAAALLAGGETAIHEGTMYAAEKDGISLRTSYGEEYCLTRDRAGSLNIFDEELWYVSGSVINRMNLEDSSTETILTWYTDIDELAVVNGSDAYFLADGNIYFLDYQGEVSVVCDDGDINGFAPTAYGIISQKGELFDRALYANGCIIQDGIFSWNVKDGMLIVNIDGSDYEQGLEDVFSEGDTSENFVLYAEDSIGFEEIFVDGDCEECEHNGEITGQAELIAQQAEAEARDEVQESYGDLIDMDVDTEEAIAVSAFGSVSSGQRNMVKRAKQQLNIRWTPKKSISGWANETVFEKGVTYRGIPYGQAIYARYIPYEEDNQTISTSALQLFLDKVNDVNSKMYTSYSSYNKKAPYYSSDCSAFVSYCWNISRTTTSALMYRANHVSDQSIYGIQIGDIMNKPDKHVVIVTDVGYTSSGKLSYIEISEQTPPIAKTTRYGSNGSFTLAELTAKYFAQGYTLYRNPNASKVSFTESSAVSVGSVSIGNNIDKANVSSGSNNISIQSSRTATGSVTSDQLGNRRDLVIRLYKRVLGRTPSDREIEGWMSNLKNGSYTGAELAAHFYFGAEGKNVIKDNTDFVIRLYKAMFARTPKDSEVRTWTDQNKFRWQYFRSFVASKEFINICNDCAIDPGTFDGTYLMEMYRDVKTFVERLYNCCLERKTDRSGLISWTCAIAGGDIGGSSAAYGFFFSDEFLALKTSNSEYVTRLYRTFFDRKPDTAGYNSWIKSLKEGNSRANVLNGFSRSREFATLCAKYGITP